jgi:hypothetical protein
MEDLETLLQTKNEDLRAYNSFVNLPENDLSQIDDSESVQAKSIMDRMTELKDKAIQSASAYSKALNEGNSTDIERQNARDDLGHIMGMGGRRRSSSARKYSRRGRRSAKKRGTQRKQKRRQRRASRRAY